jgi:hypothetical protein
MVAEGVFVMGSLTSYCRVEDVLRLLSGYDLSRLGTEEDLTARVGELLEPTRCAIDTAARRDFFFHAEDEVLVDGSGHERLVLAPLGMAPVEAIEAISVDGASVASDEYVFYGEEGTIRLRRTGRLGGVFPRGVQNVSLILDWGYPAPPAEIGLAQAKLIGAQLLAELAGERGSVESMRLGDYSVSYDAGGEHAKTIGRWVEDAGRVAAVYRGIGFAAV